RRSSRRFGNPWTGRIDALEAGLHCGSVRSSGYAIVWLVNTVLQLMVWAIIISARLSWLLSFDVISHRNRFVNQLAMVLDGITAPILAPFRRIIPPLGGLDITPIVAILTLHFLGIVFNRMSAPFLIQVLG